MRHTNNYPEPLAFLSSFVCCVYSKVAVRDRLGPSDRVASPQRCAAKLLHLVWGQFPEWYRKSLVCNIKLLSKKFQIVSQLLHFKTWVELFQTLWTCVTNTIFMENKTFYHFCKNQPIHLNFKETCIMKQITYMWVPVAFYIPFSNGDIKGCL